MERQFVVPKSLIETLGALDIERQAEIIRGIFVDMYFPSFHAALASGSDVQTSRNRAVRAVNHYMEDYDAFAEQIKNTLRGE